MACCLPLLVVNAFNAPEEAKADTAVTNHTSVVCRQRNADTPGRDSGIGGLSHRSGKALSSVFAATDPSRVRTGGTGGLGFVSDPMDFGTPDTGSVAPRMYTQDSYKEDLGSLILLLC